LLSPARILTSDHSLWQYLSLLRLVSTTDQSRRIVPYERERQRQETGLLAGVISRSMR
jgi:hypothetical protein